MKKIIIAFSILLAATATFAQSTVEKTVNCFETKKLFDILMKKYGEQPIFLGQLDDEAAKKAKVSVVVLYNPLEDSFSIVEFNDVRACVISTGNFVELSMPKPIVSK
jgi:hypothetical protein